jgi:hypothetical protein
VYHATALRDRDAKRQELQRILSVSDRTLREWFARIDKDTKDLRNRRILEGWMACYTQQEIADAIECPRQTVADVLKPWSDFHTCAETGNLAESGKAAAQHLTDFEPPLYNVWKQQERPPGPSHFGNSKGRWLDNLLYLYTQPFDIVLDLFAGSGSTIDICKQRWRRYFVSDRQPVIERAHQIRQWDITDGLPRVPRWQDVRLAYLDPPYWKQAKGQYSQDPQDLANMSLEAFTTTLHQLVRSLASKLPQGAHIAMLLQPTQWKAPDHQYTDHVADLLRLVRLPLAMRVSCPYESQQATAQMVAWAKAHRQLLVLTRELLVWRVP